MQDVCALLDVSRAELGVCTSSRGIVAGRLSVKCCGEADWIDCDGSCSIPGDCLAIQNYAFRTDARRAASNSTTCLPSGMGCKLLRDSPVLWRNVLHSLGLSSATPIMMLSAREEQH